MTRNQQATEPNQQGPTSDQQALESCGICGLSRLIVYPAYPAHHEVEEVAVCSECGAHYHPLTGWIDPEDL